jgi:hypothetical protein
MEDLIDNFALDVRACSRKSFNAAIRIALAAAPGGTASHWCEHPEFGLVLFWHAGEDRTFQGSKIKPFPREFGPKEAARWAWQWLRKADRSKFKLVDMDERYNDSDVVSEEAFRVFVEDWGHVGGNPYAVAAIRPVWAWLGK